jgi:hypothetical protein
MPQLKQMCSPPHPVRENETCSCEIKILRITHSGELNFKSKFYFIF